MSSFAKKKTRLTILGFDWGGRSSLRKVCFRLKIEAVSFNPRTGLEPESSCYLIFDLQSLRRNRNSRLHLKVSTPNFSNQLT